MFRQQINCNCTLFLRPLAPHLQDKSLELLPSYRKDNKSKKSLKYQSNSKYKQFTKGSLPKEQNESEKVNDFVSYQDIRDKYSQMTVNSAKKAVKECKIPKSIHQSTAQYKKSIRTLKIRQLDDLDKENQLSNKRTEQRDLQSLPLYPLAALDYNTIEGRETKGLISRHQGNQINIDLAKIKQTSPLTLDKMQYSAATTHQQSTVFNNSQISKKNTQNKQELHQDYKLKFNRLLGFDAYNCNKDIGSEACFQSPQKAAYSSKLQCYRSRTNSNLFKFPDFQEIISQKQESKSIYQDGQKPDCDSQDECESSRVLISCRKLMQEKNGILQPSVQAKLFDYDLKDQTNNPKIYKKSDFSYEKGSKL